MSLKPRILIVSENVYDRVLIKEYAGNKYNYLEISNINALNESINSLNPHLIIFKILTRNQTYFHNICNYLSSDQSTKFANIIICNEENLFSNQDPVFSENALFITEGMIKFSLKSLIEKSFKLLKVQTLYSALAIQEESIPIH